VTKTNGIEGEGGKSYQVALTYKLEILEDGVMRGIFKFPPSCSLEGGENSQGMALKKITGFEPIKKGDVYTVTSERNMVKSEKGWIFQ